MSRAAVLLLLLFAAPVAARMSSAQQSRPDDTVLRASDRPVGSDELASSAAEPLPGVEAQDRSVAGPDRATRESGPIDQISSAGARADGGSQITSPNLDRQQGIWAEQASSAENPVAAAPQISAPGRQTGGEEQLTREKGAVDSRNQQLSRTGASAEAPESLTARAESRHTAAQPVAGNDRCDVSSQRRAPAAVCAKVIERRANEYPRVEPTRLSPEQKLLRDQQQATNTSSVDLATRRLSKDADPETVIEQGVAAVAFDSTRKATSELPNDPRRDFLPGESLPPGAVVGVPIVK